MRTKILMALFASVLTLAPLSKAMADCFDSRSIRSVNIQDRETVDAVGTFGDVYRMRLPGCFGLNFAQRISFQRAFTCPGDNLYIMDYGNHITDRCWITDIYRVH